MFQRKIIDRETFNFLRPKNARTSRFYILPKVHKTNIPGRPIVSSCGAPTENISLYVDYHLSPLVRDLPSYIKDTNDFLTKIQTIGDIPEESLLVTLDVTSLYTNIPHKEGLDACRETLNTRTTLDPPTDDLIHLASLILEKITSPLTTNIIYSFKGRRRGLEWPRHMRIYLWANSKENFCSR